MASATPAGDQVRGASGGPSGIPQRRQSADASAESFLMVRHRERHPENEAELVVTALHSTGAQLDQLIAGIRRAGSLGKVNARHEARSVRWSWDEDGSLVLKGRFPPEDGALVIAALTAARDSLPPEDSSAEASGSGASAEASGDTEGTYPAQVTAQANADAMVVLEVRSQVRTQRIEHGILRSPTDGSAEVASDVGDPPYVRPSRRYAARGGRYVRNR